MKKTVSYNIKKVLAGTILVALPFAFGGCEKDPVKPMVKANLEQKMPVLLIQSGLQILAMKCHDKKDGMFCHLFLFAKKIPFV